LITLNEPIKKVNQQKKSYGNRASKSSDKKINIKGNNTNAKYGHGNDR